MHDLLSVQCIESRQDLEHDVERVRKLEAATLDAIGKRFPLEKLHGDKELTLVLADFVQVADVGMLNSSRGTRFVQKPLARTLVRGNGLRDGLHSDGPVELLVVAFVDDAHAALAERPLDTKASDPLRSSHRVVK